MSILVVEGNISAGKTSLCRDLAKILNYKLFLEPTITNPYLAKFYEAPKVWALPMQIWLLKQRYVTYLEAMNHVSTHGEGVILDRSIFSDWVFAEKNRIDGNICSEGFSYYMKLRSQMLGHLKSPDCIVYLDVDASVCFDRVYNMRCRDVELGIPLDYLEGLGQCYQAMLSQFPAKNTVRLPWNSFGNSRFVARHIQACLTDVQPIDPALSRFARDREAIMASMQMQEEPPFSVDMEEPPLLMDTTALELMQLSDESSDEMEALQPLSKPTEIKVE